LSKPTKWYEAENILKTKGQENGFSKNEAENILKRNLVTELRRKMTKCPNERPKTKAPPTAMVGHESLG
jgi:hypothetical protein